MDEVVEGSLVCHCYHLTDFGGVGSVAMPKMNVVDPTNPGRPSPSKHTTTSFIDFSNILCGWRATHTSGEKPAFEATLCVDNIAARFGMSDVIQLFSL